VFALLKQYRELFVTLILLVVPFATYLTYAKSGKNLNFADRIILSATSPIERGLNAVVGWGEDTWGNYVALRGEHAENLRLRQEIFVLRDENLKLEEAKRENERLRKVLDFTKADPLPTMVAEVVGLGGSSQYQILTIDKGERDGIRKGMAVVAPEGVVGKVLTITPTSAFVLLITDANLKVAVESQRTRARATVHGSGENKRFKLDMAERSSLFEDGDILVTSGTDGVFPKGLKVGRVTNIDRTRSGWYLSAEVDTELKLSRLEEVMVITSLPPGSEVPTAQIDPLLTKSVSGSSSTNRESVGVKP
jgi:rod shape-determining protein MreC